MNGAPGPNLIIEIWGTGYPDSCWLGHLLLEDCGEGAQVGRSDGDLAVGVGGLEGDGVAAAGLAHRRGVEGRGAHLAGDALAANVEAYRAADAAGVGYGDDVAVGLAEEKEADLRLAALAVVDVHAVAVQLVVVDVGGGDHDVAADQGDGGGRAERGGALGVDELGGGEEDEQEAGGDD